MNDMQQLVQQTKNIRLLFVEDDDAVRSVMLETLGIFFDDITARANGKEGLEAFKKGGFDLIITDLRMPVMDGAEMIEQIRRIDQDIPVIVISAHDEEYCESDKIHLEDELYLMKPFFVKDLVVILRNIVKEYYETE